jgi:hypothetical protein
MSRAGHSAPISGLAQRQSSCISEEVRKRNPSNVEIFIRRPNGDRRHFLCESAVTLARSASDTFAGIRPIDVPGFVVMQLAGAMAATVLARWMVPTLPEVAAQVVMPHGDAAVTSAAEPANSFSQSD